MRKQGVLVYGATGYTGRVVARELVQRGLRPVVAGRNEQRVRELAAELGSPAVVCEAKDLASHLHDVGIVINCSGPFADGLGLSVVRAAVAARCHYLDTAGEPHFVRDAVEQVGQAAKAASVCVIPAGAFEACIGDWAAEWALSSHPGHPGNPDHPGGATRVDIGYAFAEPAITPGTFASIAGELTRMGIIWEFDRWREEAHGSAAATFDFGPDFGGVREASSIALSEVVTIATRHRLGQVRSFVALGATSRFGTGLRALLKSASLVRTFGGEAGLRRMLARLAPVRTPRPGARFCVVARATGGGKETWVRVQGGSPYLLSAQILADSTQAWLVEPPTVHGVVAPALAFAAEERLRALEAGGHVRLARS